MWDIVDPSLVILTQSAILAQSLSDKIFYWTGGS